MRADKAVAAIRDQGVAHDCDSMEVDAAEALRRGVMGAARWAATTIAQEPTRRATVWDPVESIRPFFWTLEDFGRGSR